MNTEPNSDNAHQWAPFTFFLGLWKGVSSGVPGESTVERAYKFVLNQKFIQLTDRAVYQPQEKNPEGEVHQEIGYISYDGTRQQYLMREFHNEGFVIQYILDAWDQKKQKLIFRSEAFENGHPGWQARTTYEILGKNTFRETFELGTSGQDMKCYITIEFSRDQPA